MPLQAGARLGSYEVVAPIGAGGMGEVYRARDTKLHRDVAIKVLPELFAADPERLARFEREAHLLAALNHPHIAHIYGLEAEQGQDRQDARSAPFIVMEFVEGPTLAERLVHGRIPLDEALPIARQIADALETAHEQGIIHRDLKPANIKVKDDGTVKVLDFGLAKALDAGAGRSGSPGGAGGFSMSPTMISPAQMTHVGIILGTAAYMSPEQAKGREVDKRADIWAFGCVLFEMLTGKPTFAGESVTETLASVMRDAPPLGALPPETPRHIRHLLARCLERDPKQRLRDMGEARIALDPRDVEAVTPRVRVDRRTLPVATLVGALAVAIAFAVAWRMKPSAAVPLRKLDLAITTRVADLSPDGSRIAYAAGDHLLVRELAAVEPHDLGAMPQEFSGVGWSPDSKTIFMVSRDGKIRTIPASGGQPLVVCEIPESHQAVGLAWVGDEMVIAVWRGSLYRVDARGGTPKLWLAIDPNKEIDFHALAALPGGRVVFAAHRLNNVYDIQTFDGAKRTTLLPPTSISGFWYSSTGHLLFTRFETNSGLWALPYGSGPLDLKNAFLVVPNAIDASVANDGTLIAFMGSGSAGSFELVALNRTGQVERPIGAPASVIRHPAVSPDGRRVVVLRGSEDDEQVWVHDLDGGASSRLTFDAQHRTSPAWFPASDRVLFSDRADMISAAQVTAMSADGSGKPRVLKTAYRAAVSPNSRDLLYVLDERGPMHLRYAAFDANGTVGDGRRVFSDDPEPDVRDFAISPDGQMLAFIETKSGRNDLFLTRYPTGEGRWQVVASGRPRWRSTGSLRWARGTNELFFTVTADAPERARLMSATVNSAGAVRIEPAKALFEVDGADLDGGFDVTPDGKSILLRRHAAGPQKSAGPRFILVQNWPAEFADRAK
jgi:Tol biopolymer transport system component